MPTLGPPAGLTLLSRRTLLAGAAVGIAAPAMGQTVKGAALDAFLNAQLRSAGIPGMAVGVAHAGKIVFQRGYGFADIESRRRVTTETMFQLASITKTVTATAVMMLVGLGKIDLDAPANRYLDFEIANPAHPAVAITVRHLLMHLSSLSDETYYKVDFRTAGKDYPLPLDAFLKAYLLPGGAHYSAAGSFSPAAPGAAYDYCNVGYGLLGYLAGRVAGEDLRTFTQARIFAPLGMHPVSWTVAGVPSSLRATPYDVVDGRPVATEPVGFPDYPTGMLRASISGFMPFVAASANGGAAGGVRILPARDEADMLAMHKPPGLPAWLTGQGLGWMQSKDGSTPRINHWGGDPGTFTAAYIDPVSTTGVAIFTNTTATDASKAALKAIVERMFAGTPS